MWLSTKLTREQKHNYIAICELAYGCWPIDVIWATGTDIFKVIEQKLISEGTIESVIWPSEEIT